MKSLISLCVIIVTLSACSKNDENQKLDCLEDRIETFKSELSECKNSSIDKVRLVDRTVYVFGTGNCVTDGQAFVIDEDCNEVCVLWGIAGIRVCDGVDWFTGDVEVLENVWQN